MMDTLLLSTQDPNALPLAIQTLASGGLVAFPTDTVYGLAAGLFNSEGIDRLYEAKSRSANKAIAVLIAEIDQLSRLTPGLTPSAQRLAARFWPGALTLVVPKAPRLTGKPVAASHRGCTHARSPLRPSADASHRSTGDQLCQYLRKNQTPWMRGR